MTTEEKAKAYDEALERAKQKHGKFSEFVTKTIEEIFPQLRESEDERIRKALIDALKVSETIGELKFRLPYPTREECIAYLEKQKEYHIPWYDYQKSKEAGYTIVPNEEYEQLIKQKEQKPAEWSEEDEKQLDDIISIIREAYEHGITISETRHRNAYFWLTNLRPPFKPSEEQMKALLNAEGFLRAGLQHDSAKTIAELYEQLKKL